MENFRLDKLGSLISREGLTEYIVGESLSPVVQMGMWRNPDNLGLSRLLVHRTDGTIQYVNESTDSYDVLALGFGTKRGKFTNAENKIFYTNGEAPPIAYDGDIALTLGIAAPTSFTGANPTGTGPLTGTYSYVITWVDSLREIESNPSAIRTATPSSQNVVLTIPPGPDGVDQARIYRRDPGSAVFRFLANTAVNTTYTDEGAVALSPIAPPSDHSVPPNLEHIAFYNGYYFGTSDNLLHWSKALTPHAWPPLNTSELPFEGNDKVMALVAHQDALLIFGRRNILLVQGQGGQWSIIRLDVAMGLVGSDAVVETEGQVVFLSDSGIRLYPGLGVFAPTIARTLSNVSLGDKESAIMDVSPSENAIWLTIGGITYSITIATQAVSVYTLNPSAVVGGGKTGFAPNILTNPSGTRIYHHIGDWDDGTAISVKWYSKVFQLDNPESTKFVRRIGAFASEGSGSTVTITISDTQTSRTVNLQAQVRNRIVWGEFLWEDDEDTDTNFMWTNEGIVYFIGALPAQTLLGMTMQIKIDSTLIEGGIPTPTIEIVPPITLLYRESLRFLGR